jgi:hypothetical protein
VIAIDTSTTSTVRSVDPFTAPIAASIVVVPAAIVVATPVDELIVALVGSELVQVDSDVTSAVEPSLYVPVAVKDSRIPVFTVGFAGVTKIDTSVGKITAVGLSSNIRGKKFDGVPPIGVNVTVFGPELAP